MSQDTDGHFEIGNLINGNIIMLTDDVHFEFTPNQAREIARILIERADQADAGTTKVFMRVNEG